MYRIPRTLPLVALCILLCGPLSSAQQNAPARMRTIAAARRVARSGLGRSPQAGQQQIQMRASSGLNRSAPGAGGVWVSLGPMPLPSDASGIGTQDYGWVSGRALAVAIDPNDPSGNTVFAGTGGGVWKSVTAGLMSTNPSLVTWTALTDDQATFAVGAIAIQPQLVNPDPAQSVVLAGTGESNNSPDGYYGRGILRSADGGQTWSQIITQDAAGHRFDGLGFSQIAFSSSNPNLVVAATAATGLGVIEGLENPIAANRGIYYSNDAGIIWQQASIADSGVAVDPTSVTSVVYNAAAGIFYAAVQWHGFYSSNDGIKWARLSGQPGSGISSTVCPAQSLTPSACVISRGEIATVPNRPGPNNLGEMYAWYVDANDADQGIWKTLDGGATWLPINDSSITNCGDSAGCGTMKGNYNLALAAVPNGGTATDIYAGAVNLYKCTTTNAVPDCSGSGNTTFMNLTHVYGCSGIADVHPAQHAIAFSAVNGSALLYFANDGGIYRALDGYLGLRSGTCGQVNQFDSLNQNLGPIAEFVSLSQSASNVNLLFGANRGNGAPATAASQSPGPWLNVHSAEVGSTAIDSANDSEWLLATPPDFTSGVNLFSCASGVTCHTQDFLNNRLADSSVLGNDVGPRRLPFILDPQNPATLILGTCRVFRGLAMGGGFQLLSPDFENGGGGPCRGSEVNMVRSFAAGGPVDSSGDSLVIYSGTDGQGPLTGALPQGGRVWITTTAGGGLSGWRDRTGNINPRGFPISAIALDASDPNGSTAYVTIAGFHVSRIWKTINAGISWSDFTANLPDAPANTVIVDSAASTVYAGTDLGVFASSTGNPGWSALGPAAGQAGFLPGVPVTALQIFNSGGLKRLRSSTHGRGIWEWNLITAPDFQLSVANTPLEVFAGQVAGFQGTAYSLNGYSSPVSLSCTSGSTAAPQSCAATASLVPAPVGASFVVNASGKAGDYLFNIHALGSDLSSTAHDFPVALHVVDFLLSAPSPIAVSAVPGNSSSPTSVVASALGAFSGQVTLSCSGLPSGATCNFQPAAVVNPTVANPVNVTLVVSTSPGTPLGVFPVTVNAATPGSAAKTQSLSLTVGAAPDYFPAIVPAVLSGTVNTPSVFNGTLTALNGYSSAVALSCSQNAPPTCVVTPAAVIPTAAGASFSVTVSSGVSNAYNFNLNGSGADPLGIAHSVALSFSPLPQSSFDFTMGVAPLSASAAAGQAASFSISVAPSSGTFPNPVSFSCANMPALTSCAFSPSQLAMGNGTSTIALTISTLPPSRSALALSSFYAVFPIACIACLVPRKRLSKTRLRLLLILMGSTIAVSCGGGLQGNVVGGHGNPGTPVGSYSIKVTANAVSVAHSTQISLTVTP
jgi:hypothetical protein